MFSIRTFILLCCFVQLSTCLQSNNETVDYFTLLKHSQVTNEASIKYSRQKNTSPTEHLKLTNTFDRVLARAEEIQASGFDDVGPYDVSSVCLNHTKLFIDGLIGKEPWALRMIDAMGKPASGLMDFHIYWPGEWKECLSVQATKYENPKNKTGASHPYVGKYCLTSIPLETQASFGQVASLVIGMCFPDTCSSADATALARTLVSLVDVNATSQVTVSCKENSLEYTGKAIAVIVVCSLFVAIIVLATAYDVFLHFVANQQLGYKLEKGTEYGAFNDVKNERDETDDVINISESTPLYKSKQNLGKDDNGYIEQKNPPEAGTLGKMLLSFSVYSNAPKIFNTSQQSGTLTSVNGVRFLSMTWVILGHTYAFGLTLTDNIATYYPEMSKRFTFQAVSNATVSVDTFFVLSGLLVAYLSLKEMEKRGGARKFKWGMFYFHRFWRLTPTYMLLLMMYVPTFKYWGDGPFWPQTGVDVDECKDTWWTNLLYINNLVKTNKMCMGWSWYLANDMQFYVISPLMLVPLYYSPLWGSVSCLCLILVNFISAGVISKHHHFGTDFLMAGKGDGMNLYIHPWSRVGPYVVGFFTGYLLYITECKVKMSKIVNVIGWTIAAVTAMLVLYGLYTPDGPVHLDEDISALYNATSRTAWGCCIGWVIFACSTGYGGPVNKLLSWRAVIPLSRLTYCAYLVHPLVLYLYYSSRRTLMRWYDLEMTYLFLGHLCISYAAAFIVSLAFESPMMGLEKVLLGRKKSS